MSAHSVIDFGALQATQPSDGIDSVLEGGVGHMCRSGFVLQSRFPACNVLFCCSKLCLLCICPATVSHSPHALCMLLALQRVDWILNWM